jgi:hypothetical protein
MPTTKQQRKNSHRIPRRQSALPVGGHSCPMLLRELRRKSIAAEAAPTVKRKASRLKPTTKRQRVARQRSPRPISLALHRKGIHANNEAATQEQSSNPAPRIRAPCRRAFMPTTKQQRRNSHRIPRRQSGLFVGIDARCSRASCEEKASRLLSTAEWLVNPLPQ